MNLFSPAEELLFQQTDFQVYFFGVCTVINHELRRNTVKIAVRWHIFCDVILPSMKSSGLDANHYSNPDKSNT